MNSPVGFFAGDWTLRDSHEPDTFLLDVNPDNPFRFHRPDGTVIVIEREFLTDGATIPRIFRWFNWLDPFGAFRNAAFIHDWLWILRLTRENQLGFFASNQVLYEGCLADGLSRWRANIIWFGVTVGGWPLWIFEKRQAPVAQSALDTAHALLVQRGLRK